MDLIKEFVEWSLDYSYDWEELTQSPSGDWLLTMWDYQLVIPHEFVEDGGIFLHGMTVEKATVILQANGLEGNPKEAAASLSSKEAAKAAARKEKEAKEAAEAAARKAASARRAAEQAAKEAALLSRLTTEVGRTYRPFKIDCGGCRIQWPHPTKDLTVEVWVASYTPPLSEEEIEAAEEAAVAASMEIPFKGKRIESHWKSDSM